MPRHAPAALRELELWLNASIAEAERLLPNILDKPRGVLERELAARPELRTAGMMQRLITLAHELLEGYPRWAHELTSIAVKLLPSIAVPPSRVAIVRRLHAQAWIEHAQASLGIGATAEARDAIDAARGLLDQTPAQEWYLATADVVEAQILHDLGRGDDAFTLVQRAAAHFALHGDYDRYLHARMIEAWMFWNAGEHAAAADVWRETADTAQQRGNRILLARLKSHLGGFELRRGNAEEAGRLLSDALAVFVAAGATKDAVRTRWSLAEATAARGRVNEAISEYYKVRAELLAMDEINDAAVASAEILDLMLVAGRDRDVASLAEMLVVTFRETKMPRNAVQAWTFVSARAEARELTREDVAAVRRYFEELAVQPNAPFVAPESA